MFFLILATDYLSKMWASISFRTPVRVFSWFDLVYVENKGISFGLLFGILNPYVMAIGALCICAVLFFCTWKKSHYLEKYGYVAIFAGAIGNVLDRLIEGAVVDFIYLHIKDYYWPAFNIADSAICCGVFWILFVQWMNKKSSGDQKTDA